MVTMNNSTYLFLCDVLKKVFSITAILNEVGPARSKGWITLLIGYRASSKSKVRIDCDNECVYVSCTMKSQQKRVRNRVRHSPEILWSILPMIWKVEPRVGTSRAHQAQLSWVCGRGSTRLMTPTRPFEHLEVGPLAYHTQKLLEAILEVEISDAHAHRR